MKVFRRYLNYRLKQSLLRTVVFTALSVMICLSVTSDCISLRLPEDKTTGLYMLAVILGAFCTLIPLLELSAFKNRRNLDTLYFFPINRGKMALVHYLSGLLQIFAIYTVSFLSVFILLLVRTDCFLLGYMPLYYLCSLILGIVVYSIFMFIFGEANTVADGVIFCGLWIFAIYAVLFAVTDYLLSSYYITTDGALIYEYRVLEDMTFWGIIYAPINNLTVIFQDTIEAVRMENWISSAEKWGQTITIYSEIYLSQIYMFFAWIALGIAAAVGFFVRFTKKGANMAGEISESPFGFKLLIPLYGYTLLFISGATDIITIIIFALMLAGYFIYRRSFKIKVRDIVVIACGIIPMMLYEILR